MTLENLLQNKRVDFGSFFQLSLIFQVKAESERSGKPKLFGIYEKYWD